MMLVELRGRFFYDLENNPEQCKQKFEEFFNRSDFQSATDIANEIPLLDSFGEIPCLWFALLFRVLKGYIDREDLPEAFALAETMLAKIALNLRKDYFNKQFQIGQMCDVIQELAKTSIEFDKIHLLIQKLGDSPYKGYIRLDDLENLASLYALNNRPEGVVSASYWGLNNYFLGPQKLVLDEHRTSMIRAGADSLLKKGRVKDARDYTKLLPVGRDAHVAGIELNKACFDRFLENGSVSEAVDAAREIASLKISGVRVKYKLRECSKALLSKGKLVAAVRVFFM